MGSLTVAAAPPLGFWDPSGQDIHVPWQDIDKAISSRRLSRVGWWGLCPVL